MELRSPSITPGPTLVWMILLVPALANAGDWRLSPSVSLGASDVQTSLQTGGSLNYGVYSVAPSLALSGSGSHASANFSYTPTLIRYTGYSSQTYLTHALNASGTAELYRNVVFLSGYARAGLAQNSTLSAPVDSTSLPNNRIQTFAAAISPQVRQHMGTFADLVTTTTFGYSGAGTLPSTSNESLSMVLNSGRRFHRLGWAVSGSAGRSHNQYISDNSRAFNGRLSYLVTQKLQVVGGVGYSSSTAPSNFNSNGSANWQLGANWTPNATNTLTADFGHSYYGYHWQTSIDHVSRRTHITATWSRALTNSATLLSSGTQPALGPNGQPLLDPITGQPLQQSNAVVVSSNNNFVQTTAALTAALTGMRTTITGTLSYTRDDLGGAVQSTARTLASLAVSRQVSPITSLTGAVTYSTVHSDIAGGDNAAVQATVGMHTQLGPHSVLSGSYAWLRFRGDALTGYVENRIGVNFRYTFD